MATTKPSSCNWATWAALSPGKTSELEGLLEHPAEVFAYYRHEGVPRVVCEEKHMGSRAVVVLCRDEDVARQRFGHDVERTREVSDLVLRRVAHANGGVSRGDAQCRLANTRLRADEHRRPLDQAADRNSQ